MSDVPSLSCPRWVCICRGLMCLLGCLFATASVSAAPPPNDVCATAEIIPAAGPFPYFTAWIPDLSTATTNGDPASPSCASEFEMDNGVWYRFTPSTTRRYTISAATDSGTSVEDNVLAIYQAIGGTCAGPLVEIACSDDEADRKAALSLTLNAGTTYFVVLSSLGSIDLDTTNITARLRVTTPVTPANDTCAGAISIPVGGPFPHTTALADTTLATEAGDPAPPACAPNVRRGLWYCFTPTTSTSYTFSTGAETATSVSDTALGLYTSANNCAGPFTAVACSDNGDGRGALTHSLTAGTSYYLLVWEGGTDVVTLGETCLEIIVRTASPPTVNTLAATNINSSSALLTASVNPNGQATAIWFEWGQTTNYGSLTSTRNLGNGMNPVFTDRPVAGLMPDVTYHYRVVATNVAGRVNGLDRTFSWSSTLPAIIGPEWQSPGGFKAHFAGNPGQQYQVEGSTDLAGWEPVGPAREVAPGQFEFVDAAAPAPPHRFYRIFSP